MTSLELMELVGKEGTWTTPIGSLKVRVKILDARKVYGRLELRITPIAGSGDTWAQNVAVDKPSKSSSPLRLPGTSGAPGGL